MKLAIVVGHNEKAQGAVRITDGKTEFEWNSHLAELIRELEPGNVKVFKRTAGGGYRKEIRRVYAEVDAWGADFSVELHFNGSPNPEAEGCLMLSSGTKNSLRLAEELQRRCLEVMENEDDGVLVRKRNERGGESLWAGKAPAVLAEPYFGGNRDSCELADERKEQLAKAIYFGALAVHTGLLVEA